MKGIQLLNRAILVLGFLSFISLIGYFLALHDIWHDYAGPEVWARAGQGLPEWYSPVNRTPAEWGVVQFGFCFMLLFHVLLFVKLVLRDGISPNSSGRMPVP
jgi:hypothetical protein